MTRPIKFRAFHRNFGQMFDVYALGYDKDQELEEIQVDTLQFDRTKEKSFNWLSAKDLEPMQFTGLTDKNGKEVYEGDIMANCVNYPNSHAVKKGDIMGVVEFRDGGFFYGEHEVLTGTSSKDLEVIGNIYEDKELLK